jgi:hypothetical protein
MTPNRIFSILFHSNFLRSLFRFQTFSPFLVSKKMCVAERGRESKQQTNLTSKEADATKLFADVNYSLAKY